MIKGKDEFIKYLLNILLNFRIVTQISRWIAWHRVSFFWFQKGVDLGMESPS